MAKKKDGASSSVEVSPEIATLQQQLDAMQAQAKEVARQIREVRQKEEQVRIDALKVKLAPKIAALQKSFDALGAQLPDNHRLSLVDGDITIVVKRARRSASRVYEWVTEDGTVYTNMQGGLTALDVTEKDVMDFATDADNSPNGEIPKYHTTAYTCLRTAWVSKHFGLKRHEVKTS